MYDNYNEDYNPGLPSDYCRKVRKFLQGEYTQRARSFVQDGVTPVAVCGELCPTCGLACVGFEQHAQQYEAFPVHACPAEHVWEDGQSKQPNIFQRAAKRLK